MVYLKDIKNTITDILSGYKNINYITDDLLSLNSPDVKYSAAVVEHTSTVFKNYDDNGGQFATYHFTVFIADLDVNNTTDIQSNAEQLLIGLYSKLEEDYLIDDEMTITPFKHRFTSLCSGCYAEFSITTDYHIECK